MPESVSAQSYDSSIKYIRLNCQCKGQTLSRRDSTEIVSGQNCKVIIAFTLSEEWTGMAIYARFKPSRGSAIDIGLSSDFIVEVPHEVTDTSGTFELALRAENLDGRIITSNPVDYTVVSTINGKGAASSPATKTIYQEFLSAKNNVDETLSNFTKEVESGKYNSTIEIGNVAAGTPGSNPSVSNVGTNQKAILNFTIPKGDKGDTATVTVGTVTGTAAGSKPTVTNVGDSHDAILNFTIPKGDKGDYGIGYQAPEYDDSNGQYTNDSIEGWLSMNRNGKEYGIRIPKSIEVDCVKLGANANIVIPTTSTIENPGNDPYIAEGGPFRYTPAMGGVDENGVPYCSGIKGDGHFTFRPATDNVYSLVPILWIKIEETDSYTDLWISDTWHPGYSLFKGCVLPDGTIRPYLPIARYGLSIDENGNARSVSGVKCRTLDVSHNSMITQCKTASTGYSGKSSMDELYVKIMLLMKYGSKNSQKYFSQCSGYTQQCLLSVAETGVKRVIITNAQAGNLKINSGMQLGTNTTGSASTDRNNSLARDIFYDEQITRIETYDDTHKAVYFDNVTDTFDTTTSCLLSTSHWWCGCCDDVQGDGSPTNCTNGTEPFLIQGVEIGYGFYEILGNEICANKDGLGWDLYVNYDSRNESTGVTSNYQQIDLNLSGEGYGVYPYIDNGCSFQAQRTGGSSSTGMCDYIWTDKAETKAEREVRSLGCLGSWSVAGLWFAYCDNGLGGAWWSFGSRLSLIGRSKG